MKLWKKIALVSCVVLVLLFSGSFLAVTEQVKNNYLSHTYDQVWDDHHELIRSFLRQMQKERIDPNSAMAAESKTKYIFSQLGKESSVLIRDGKIISSHVPFSPLEVIQPEDDGATKSQYTKIDGVPYLLFGTWLRVFPDPDPGLLIYTVVDLTPQYDEIHQMALSIAGITGTGLLLCLALIVLLVWYSMRPLEKLTQAAAHISEGNYTERTEIHAKDEIGDLSSSFDRMADSVQRQIDSLQEQNRRQKLFIGAVTHEFKTPLTSLLLNADTLQNTYLTDDQRDETIGQMESQCKWLEQIMQSLLKLLTAPQDVSLQEVSLSELMESVRDSMQDVLNKYQVRLELAYDETMFRMDRELMQCALQNLVQNAAKASKPGQVIQIYVHGSTFEVSDHGKGIPQQDLPRITEPFYMVDKSRSKKQGGIGLGLALVKEIIEAHGSTLLIESTETVGTTVSFTLPKF